MPPNGEHREIINQLTLVRDLLTETRTEGRSERKALGDQVKRIDRTLEATNTEMRAIGRVVAERGVMCVERGKRISGMAKKLDTATVFTGRVTASWASARVGALVLAWVLATALGVYAALK